MAVFRLRLWGILGIRKDHEAVAIRVNPMTPPDLMTLLDRLITTLAMSSINPARGQSNEREIDLAAEWLKGASSHTTCGNQRITTFGFRLRRVRADGRYAPPMVAGAALGVVLRAAAVLLVTLAMTPFQTAAASSFQKVYASSNQALLTKWGRRYERGERVRKNVDRAIRLYCKAAKKGHAPAQYHLGWMYANGNGVQRNDALAAAWLRKAASKNHLQARNTLKLVQAKKKRSAQCLLSDGLPIGAKRRYAHPAKGRITKMVHNLAPEYRLNPNLVLAVIEAESNFNPKARSPKNAQGLMQLIPATAQRFGVKDVWDPEQNLRGGMAYLRWLLDHFNGDVKLALAGYNAGEAAVRRHRGIPPYDETQSYVKRIARRLSP